MTIVMWAGHSSGMVVLEPSNCVEHEGDTVVTIREKRVNCTPLRSDDEVWGEMLRIFGRSHEVHRRFLYFQKLWDQGDMIFEDCYARALKAPVGELPDVTFTVRSRD